MKKTTLLLLLFAISLQAQTPSWTWAKNISLSSNDGNRLTAVDASGNVYLTGSFVAPTLTIGTTTLTNNSTFASFWDFYIVKYNRAGDILWAKSFGGPNADSVVSMDTDAQGNLYVSGTFQEHITLGDFALTTVLPQNFIMKLNPEGDVVWARTGDPDNYVSVSDLAIGLDGNLYLSGVFASPQVKYDGTVFLEYEHFNADTPLPRPYVIKFDTDGNPIWMRGGQSDHMNVMATYSHGVAADAQGNVFLTGRFNCNEITFGDITLVKTTTYTHSSNMFIVKYDSDGVAQWAKRAGTIYENNTHGMSVDVDADGNSFVAGFFSNTISWDDVSIVAMGGSAGYVAKFGPDGTTLWAKAAQAVNSAAWNKSVSVGPDGAAYVGGLTFSQQVQFAFGGLTLSTSGEGLAYVVRYDSDGNPTWGRKIDPLNMNNHISVSCLTANEIYVGGTFFNQTLSLAPFSLTRDPLTNYNLFLGRLYYEPLAVEGHEHELIRVFPNPTDNHLVFGPLTGHTAFRIFDIVGNLVHSGEGNSEYIEVDISHLSSGIYWLDATDENNAFGRRIVRK